MIGDDLEDAGRIFECPGCHRRTYPEHLWATMSAEERAASGGVGGKGDFCDACYRYPNRRDPEPGEPYEDPTCAGCGKEMIRPAHWNRAGEAERAELFEEGYVRERREGRCWDCIAPERRERGPRLSKAELNERRKVRGQTVKQYLALHAEGITDHDDIADRIGITAAGLRKALRLARKAGQEIP